MTVFEHTRSQQINESAIGRIDGRSKFCLWQLSWYRTHPKLMARIIWYFKFWVGLKRCVDSEVILHSRRSNVNNWYARHDECIELKQRQNAGFDSWNVGKVVSVARLIRTAVSHYPNRLLRQAQKVGAVAQFLSREPLMNNTNDCLRLPNFNISKFLVLQNDYNVLLCKNK